MTIPTDAKAIESPYPSTIKNSLAFLAGYTAALKAARNAAELFPNDTKNSLHKFGAKTVVRAIYRAADDNGLDLLIPQEYSKP